MGEYVNGLLETTVWSNLGADEYLARLTGGTMQVPLTDGLGSVRNLTDALGAVTASLSYEPYGRTPNASPLQYPYTFTSREADVDGLMYYRARYYDPALGRFISQDPLGLSAGVNAYAYAVSNPMSFTDPSGTSAKGAATILEALMGWIAGTLPTTVFGPAHPVTQDIRRTPAMDSIRKKYRQANCASKQYCGDYNEPEFFKTNNIVGHTIGAFCADLTNLGNGKVKVRAQNTWGLESGTRIPETFFGNNRNNSSVQEMLSGKGPWQYPKSFLENKKTPGMFRNVTLWFLWTENLPCRCQ